MRRLLDNYAGVILTAFMELESVIRARGDFSDFMGKGAAVNIHFNGAATKTVYVDVAAQYPGSNNRLQRRKLVFQLQAHSGCCGVVRAVNAVLRRSGRYDWEQSPLELGLCCNRGL
jgi:hypothetical protein